MTDAGFLWLLLAYLVGGGMCFGLGLVVGYALFSPADKDKRVVGQVGQGGRGG